MRPLLLASFLAAPLALSAQDTIHVQTLTFDSITTRRGWWQFPDSTHTFRKVLMHHTLKCDPLTTWDSYDCGEWDYLTYSFVHDHTGVLDSNAQQHPYFRVGNAVPDSIVLTGSLPIDIRQRAQWERSIINTISETDHSVGIADATDDLTLSVVQGAGRSQFLFTAAELAAAGLGAGEIQRIRVNVVNGGALIDRLILRMKNTLANSIQDFDELGLLTVLDRDVTLTSGVNTLTLTWPFNWDGISNLLVEMDTERHGPWSGAHLAATDVGPDLAVRDIGRDGYLELNNDFLGVAPSAIGLLSDQVTITFRAFGDAIIPVNNSILEGMNDQGQRLLNVHLPWSDGSVYWDAGNDGGGYDRINKATVPANVEGQWNHWAFTKNTTTGSMKIYLNGVLWHSGTGKTKPMDGIARFKIGSAANGNLNYPGLLDEFCVFNTEVDAATIAAWADRRTDAAHPSYASLLYVFHFDELPVDLQAFNAVNGSQPAWPLGTVQRRYKRAMELGSSPVTSTIRPDITFVQGTYDTTIDSTIALDPEVQAHLSKETFQVAGNSVVPLDTVIGWSGGYTYTFDTAGSAIDSSYVSGATFLNDTLDYFATPYEVIDNWEIGRYITPYGINLTLGPNGFRWTYDVTDYQYLLHDSVDLSAGNTQELIDLEFEMIEGTPPRELVRHQRPWGPQRSYSYANLSNDISLAPVTVDLHPDATQWAVRSRFTGHGHNSNDGEYPHCCEWKDNTHYLSVNSTPADNWHIWQTHDCALNPVYPQGGTWLGAREGWCPGDVVKDHWTEITPLVSGDSATLDYSITPVPAGNLGMGGGNYVVNMDLYEFGAATHPLDAEIYEVKRPNDRDYHRRENPICLEPVVVLRNAGAQDLTSVTFTYSVSGGIVESHTWTGSLGHMESTEVTLPIGSGWFWTGDSLHLFTATVSAPNGGVDGYADNDSYTTHFALPVIYTDPVKVYYKTNNRPWDNEVVIKDMYGTAVYQKDWSTLPANTIFTDTLALTPGCYTLEMLDTGNDGLSYWADPDQGSGFLRLRKVSGGTLKNFTAEFGRSIHWSFAINEIVGVEELADVFDVSIAPNPGEGRFTLTTSQLEGSAMIEVYGGTGALVRAQAAELTGTSRVLLDLEGEDDGLYLVRLTCEGRTATMRVIKQ